MYHPVSVFVETFLYSKLPCRLHQSLKKNTILKKDPQMIIENLKT